MLFRSGILKNSKKTVKFAKTAGAKKPAAKKRSRKSSKMTMAQKLAALNSSMPPPVNNHVGEWTQNGPIEATSEDDSE